MKNGLKLAFAVLGLALLSGCATSRSVLDVPTPAAEKAAQANGKAVYINSANDKRFFESNPSSPNIPSLDPSEAQNSDIKLRSIGRKRNTYGKALGDLILKEGQTVESLTKSSLRQAFTEKGYKVIDSKAQINSSTYIIDADIDKFWSWMNPGFASITLSTEISTNLTIKAPDGTIEQVIAVKAADNFQTGADGNWIEVINKALRAYMDEIKTKIK